MRVTESPRRPRCRGAGLIEFAFIALLLSMTTFTLFEMDRMLLVMTALADSTRAGVRYAIVHGADNPTTEATIERVIKNFAGTGALNPANLNFTSNYSASATPGTAVKITVTYRYDPFTSYFHPLNVTLSSTSEGIITY